MDIINNMRNIVQKILSLSGCANNLVKGELNANTNLFLFESIGIVD